MLSVVISGGLGLLGSEVAAAIYLKNAATRGVAVSRVLLIDAVSSSHQTKQQHRIRDDILSLRDRPDAGAARAEAEAPLTARVIRGDVESVEIAFEIERFADEANGEVSIFHLASIMSAQGEADFEEAFRVNVNGTRSLLQTCRRLECKPRFVFTSSIAALGPGTALTDDTKLLPEVTYGMTKAAGELLVNDFTRKGIVDGRVARLPTTIIRPGPPNAAATGCYSSVPKAVLHGQEFVSPVSPDIPHACISLSSAVQGLLALHDAPEKSFGRDRAVTLPSLSLTLADLEQSAVKLARELGIRSGKVAYEPDMRTESVVRAMPSSVTTSQFARDIGLPRDAGADSILREYAERVGLSC